jgi:hypothetical protein
MESTEPALYSSCFPTYSISSHSITEFSTIYSRRSGTSGIICMFFLLMFCFNVSLYCIMKVKDNKLTVPPVEFYYLLPGFNNLDSQEADYQNTPRVLYIKYSLKTNFDCITWLIFRYRWKKNVYIRFFVDGSKISIP